MTLLGIDDNFDEPEIRIVVFSPSGNGKYFPNEKYKPGVQITEQEDAHTNTRMEGEPRQHRPLKEMNKSSQLTKDALAHLGDSSWSPDEESVYRIRSSSKKSARESRNSKQLLIANVSRWRCLIFKLLLQYVK